MAGQLLHIAASKLFRNQNWTVYYELDIKKNKNIVINTCGWVWIEKRDVCFHDVNIRGALLNFRILGTNMQF